MARPLLVLVAATVATLLMTASPAAGGAPPFVLVALGDKSYNVSWASLSYNASTALIQGCGGPRPRRDAGMGGACWRALRVCQPPAGSAATCVRCAACARHLLAPYRTTSSRWPWQQALRAPLQGSRLAVLGLAQQSTHSHTHPAPRASQPAVVEQQRPGETGSKSVRSLGHLEKFFVEF